MKNKKGLWLEGVEIILGGRRLLRLDEVIAPGEVLTVKGPSGSGKSTLFALIAGFMDSAFEASGRVSLNGRSLWGLPPERRKTGLLFQDALLFPHMSVGENLVFAVPANVRGRRARRNLAAAMLERVEMPNFLDRDPATLSGGQAARVALARTLLAEPEALLLDEPFSRLDVELRALVRGLVFALVAERNIPALLVTHDTEDAPCGGRILDIAAPSPSSGRVRADDDRKAATPP